jgi:hypothetical protein
MIADMLLLPDTTTMRRWPQVILLAVLLSPTLAHAGQLELALSVGRTAPRYNQIFRYDPPVTALPGVSVSQGGAFTLDAQGGFAGSAALTWEFLGSVGLEARVDVLSLQARTSGGRYDVQVTLPGGLPPVRTSADLSGGVLDVERPYPLSLNLRLRTPGRVRLLASGGVSYLPRLRASARQPIAIGPLDVLGALGGSVQLSSLELRAEAIPTERDRGRFGVNAGLGLQLALTERVALLADARAFVFSEQVLQWSAGVTGRPPTAAEQQVLDQIQRELDPVKFRPTVYQASAGLALRF